MASAIVIGIIASIVVIVSVISSATSEDYLHSKNNFQPQKGRVQYPATRRILASYTSHPYMELWLTE